MISSGILIPSCDALFSFHRPRMSPRQTGSLRPSAAHNGKLFLVCRYLKTYGQVLIQNSQYLIFFFCILNLCTGQKKWAAEKTRLFPLMAKLQKKAKFLFCPVHKFWCSSANTLTKDIRKIRHFSEVAVI